MSIPGSYNYFYYSPTMCKSMVLEGLGCCIWSPYSSSETNVLVLPTGLFGNRASTSIINYPKSNSDICTEILLLQTLPRYIWELSRYVKKGSEENGPENFYLSSPETQTTLALRDCHISLLGRLIHLQFIYIYIYTHIYIYTPKKEMSFQLRNMRVTVITNSWEGSSV